MNSTKEKIVTFSKILNANNIDILVDGVLARGQITTFFSKRDAVMSDVMCNTAIYNNSDLDAIYLHSSLHGRRDNLSDKITIINCLEFTSDDKNNIIDMLLSANDKEFENTILVIDSLSDFVNIKHEKDIDIFYKKLIKIRDTSSATIIINAEPNDASYENSDNATNVIRLEDTGYYLLENIKCRAMLSPVLSMSIDYDTMIMQPEEIPIEKTYQDAVDLIKDAIRDESLSVTEIKKRMKGIIGANKVGTILSDLKGREFMFKKDTTKHNGWLVSLIDYESKDEIKESDFKLDDINGLF